MKSVEPLTRRRMTIDNLRNRFEKYNVEQKKCTDVSDDIVNSWERSSKSRLVSTDSAPIDCELLAKERWRESPLSVAAANKQSYLKQLVKEGQFAAAIADPFGRLLWTCSSNFMSKHAEKHNFIIGGHWGEQDVGTNAVGLSLELKRPVTVFAGEHYAEFLNDWVCYSAPIRHPISGACVGVLDITTLWNKHTPLGQSATMEIANSISRSLPDLSLRAEIEIYAMGRLQVLFRGRAINLPPRQVEILCLLALNPDGLSLVQLHASLYGDEAVSTATLKADVSHLRRQLCGGIGSRPYRLVLPFWADFVEIWKVLNNDKACDAMSLYRGGFLERSQSPEIEEWRYCIDAVMGHKIETIDSPGQLIKSISENTSGSIILREKLTELLGK